MKTKRILVLGSTGRVGRLLRLAWDRNPPEGIALILQSRGPDGVQWQPGDPVRFGPVDAVIALWGVTRGDAAELAVNAELALIAQQVAAECGARRVLHCSSIAVYARKDSLLTEGDPTKPANPYGAAKLQMEQALQTAPGPQAVCLRIGSVAGAESLAANIQRGGDNAAKPLVLDRFSDGKGPARSYIAPSDLAQVLIGLAMAETVPDVLNLGGPDPVFMEDLLRAADHPMRWQPAPQGAWQYATLNCQRLASVIDLPDNMSDPQHIMADWLGLEPPE